MSSSLRKKNWTSLFTRYGDLCPSQASLLCYFPGLPYQFTLRITCYSSGECTLGLAMKNTGQLSFFLHIYKTSGIYKSKMQIYMKMQTYMSECIRCQRRECSCVEREENAIFLLNLWFWFLFPLSVYCFIAHDHWRTTRNFRDAEQFLWKKNIDGNRWWRNCGTVKCCSECWGLCWIVERTPVDQSTTVFLCKMSQEKTMQISGWKQMRLGNRRNLNNVD